MNFSLKKLKNIIHHGVLGFYVMDQNKVVHNCEKENRIEFFSYYNVKKYVVFTVIQLNKINFYQLLLEHIQTKSIMKTKENIRQVKNKTVDKFESGLGRK